MAAQELNTAQLAFADLETELENTRKILALLPDTNFDWKPNPKGWAFGRLAQHVAQLPFFFSAAVNADDYDLATWKQPPEPTSADEIRQDFEARAAEALEAYQKLTPEMLRQQWTLRAGDQVFFQMHRAAVLRAFAISHIIHHRGQLTIYYRSLNIGVPGLYGPSADES